MSEYVILNCESCKEPVVKIHTELLARIKKALHYDEDHGPHLYHVSYQGGFEVTRELTDSDLVDLCTFADKLDVTGHEVYAIQFNEHLEELARETGLPIPEIKNRAREYRNRR